MDNVWSLRSCLYWLFRRLPVIIQVYLIGVWYLLVEMFWSDLPEIHPTLQPSSTLTCVVTGAGEGIGLELAKLLLDYNCRIVIVTHRYSDSVRDLIRWRGRPTVEFVHCNLASRTSVLKASEALRKMLPDGIDVLVNNAGVMYHPCERNDAGIEWHMAVNVVGHLSLTLNLLSLLERRRGRVVNVSSVVCRAGRLNCLSATEDDDGDDADYDPYAAYADSKLAVVLMTQALAEHFVRRRCAVTVVSGHPGVTPTALYRYTNPIVELLIRCFPGPQLMRNRRSVARDLLFLCFADGLLSGAYYEHAKPVDVASGVSTEDKQLLWWELFDSANLSSDAERYWKKTEKTD